MLLNNKFVSLVSAGKLSEAYKILPSLAKHAGDPTFRSHYLAANGIMAFREGRIVQGRDYYLEAISTATERDDPVRAFMAYAYWLEQEISVGVHDASFSHNLVDHLDSQVQKMPSRDREWVGFTWEAMKGRLLAALAQQTMHQVVSFEEDERLLTVNVAR